MAGGKDVENRTWPTRYRGALLIHAGAATERYATRAELPAQCDVHGCVVGVVELVDCIRGGRSKWAEPDHWHWTLARPRAFRVPIPATGRLGLWAPSQTLIHRLPAYVARG